MEAYLDEKIINEKKEQIKGLKKKYGSNIDKQEELYMSYLEKFKPIIDFIKHERYWFSHPDLKEGSTGGPILGKDNTKNMLYVYDLKDGLVKEISLFNNTETSKIMCLDQYFELFDFEEAIKGLTGLLGYQDKIIKELEEENKISEALVKKYEISIDRP